MVLVLRAKNLPERKNGPTKTLSLKPGDAPAMEPARFEAAIVQPSALPHRVAFPDAFEQALCSGPIRISGFF
jgi:hypothetical protein